MGSILACMGHGRFILSVLERSNPVHTTPPGSPELSFIGFSSSLYNLTSEASQGGSIEGAGYVTSQTGQQPDFNQRRQNPLQKLAPAACGAKP